MPTKKKLKTTKKVIATRPVSTLDLTKPLKVSAAAKPRSKSDVFGTIAQHVGLHRRDVAAVFHALGSLIKADLSKLAPVSSRCPDDAHRGHPETSTKARMGLNPFTKEEVMFKAKPARNVVRVRPLRGLKDMV